MSEQTYFVKIRGRSLGPFTMEKLSQMAQQGQLSRVHMLSTDGNSWQKAGSLTEIFQVSTLSASQSTSLNPTTAVPQQQVDQPIVINSENDDKVWHYGINGDSSGPVSKSEIVRLINSGDLSESDLLWRAEMREWTEVEHVHEFAKYFSGEPFIDAGSTRGKTKTLDKALSGTTQLLRRQVPWVYFISSYMFIWAIGLFFVFVWGLIEGGKQQNPVLITTALSSLANMGVVITAAIFLVRYTSDSSRFTTTKNLADLNRSLGWLEKFWLLIGILIIIQIVLAVALAIYLFSLSTAVIP
jgi:hypothetical protein